VGTPIDPGAGSGRTILVLGGTGQTGRELTRQALARGHGVHALVRSAERLGVVASRLAVTVGCKWSNYVAQSGRALWRNRGSGQRSARLALQAVSCANREATGRLRQIIRSNYAK